MRTWALFQSCPSVEHELALDAGARAVVLVEGVSDRSPCETLAELHGRDLDAERVSVVPIGGAQAIGRYLERYGPRGLGLRLAGLCDAGEERGVPPRARARRRRLDLAPRRDGAPRLLRLRRGPRGRADPRARAGRRRAGGRGAGDSAAFRTLQKQPEWRDGPPRSSCAASWAAAAAGRSATRASSSRRSACARAAAARLRPSTGVREATARSNRRRRRRATAASSSGRHPCLRAGR